MVSVKISCLVFVTLYVLQSHAQLAHKPPPFGFRLTPPPPPIWKHIFTPPPRKGPIWKSGDWSLGKGGLKFGRWSLGKNGLQHTFKNGISIHGKPDLKFSFRKPFVKFNGFSVGVRIPFRRRRAALLKILERSNLY